MLSAAVSRDRKRLYEERGYLNPPSQREKKSIEMSRRHSSRDFAKVSAPERVIADWLISRGYKMVIGDDIPGDINWQYNLFGKYCVDFALPQRKMAIEVLGDWWHGWKHLCGEEAYEHLHPQVKRNLHLDKTRFSEIEEQGWVLLKIWEHDVKDKSFVETLSPLFPAREAARGDSAGVLLLEATHKSRFHLSEIVKSQQERWNARYLEVSSLVKMKNSYLDLDNAKRLRLLLDQYGDSSLIPESVIEEEFRKARSMGFPYNNLSEDDKLDDWARLERAKTEKVDGLYNWTGMESRLATAFHPHFYECRKKGKISPLEFFNDDECLKRGIRKQLCLEGKIVPSNLRSICRNENESSLITNFPPRVALAIVRNLFSSRIRVLDPCAGFSGRLLGCAASGLVSEYWGIDLSVDTVKGLNDTAAFLGKTGASMRCRLFHGDCLAIMPLINEDFDLVFTSPPFLDMEEYKGVPFETSYWKWLREFVGPFVRLCKDRLKPKGKLVIYSENINTNKRFSADLSQLAEKEGLAPQNPIRFKKNPGVYKLLDYKYKITNVNVWEKH